MDDQRTRTAPRVLVGLLALASLLIGISVARAHDFGGPSNGGGGDPPPPGPPCNSCPCAGPGGGGGGGGGGGPGNSGGNPGASGGKPVSFYNGAEEMTLTDLVVNGVFPILIQRKYDSRSSYDSPLGYGWSFLHDRRLYEYPDNSVVVRHGCGTRDRYVFSGGGYVTPTGSMLSDLSEQPDGSFHLKYLNGVTDVFDSQGRLTSSSDARGNRHEYTYDSRGKLPLVGSSKESIAPTQPMTVAYNFRLTRIDERGANGALTGRFVTFAYDENTGRLAAVTADDNRSVTYQHDVSAALTLGNLTQVNGLEAVIATYAYADPRDPHNMTSITPAQGRTPIVNTYDDQDRVIRQEEGTRRMDLVYNVPYTRTTVTRTIRNHDGLNPYTAVMVYDFDTTGRVTKLTDPLGHETRYKYNAAKLLSRQETWQKDGATLSLAQAIDWTYDANGSKLTESVALDSGETIIRSWTYEQNWIASEQVVSSTAPAKIFRTEYTFYFGADGRPTNVQSEKRRKDDGSFQTTTYTYDSRNRLLTTTLPDGVQFVNEYTGDYVTRRYFLVGGSPIQQLEQRFEYGADGNLARRWDARDNLTEFVYDDRGRLITVTNPLGEQTIYTYSNDRLELVETGRTAAAGEGQVTKYLYDGRDRVIGVQRKSDSGAFVTQQTLRLDSEGRRIGVIDALNRTTLIGYDLLGRVAMIVDPAGKTTQFAYDARGNRVSITDALSRQIRYEYDDLDRVVAKIEAATVPGGRTELSYDAAGNLVALEDAENHTTIFQFNSLSQKTRVTQPGGQFVQYVYDGRGRVQRILDSRGHKTEFAYEEWGYVSEERRFATAAATVPSRTIAYTYDDDGNITSESDSGVQATPLYSMTYDALGRMHDETVKYVPGGDRVLRHRYDRYGNRSELTLQDTAAITSSYSYDKLNRLTSATLAGATSTLQYYDDDSRQSISLPNGVTESFSYFSNGPVQTLSVAGPAGVLDQLSYTYDDVLNVDTQTDQYGMHDFNYDALYRLTQVQRPVAAGLPNESYTYDRVGNREDAVNAALYDYDVNNRLTSSPGLTYSYDTDGQLASRSDGASFVHDLSGRMTGFAKGAVSAEYEYEPSGRRIRKIVAGAAGTTFYVWDGTELLAEYDAAGVLVKRYARVGDIDGPIQVQDAAGTYYVHLDHLQTPRFATNAAAQVAWRARYAAFGQATVDEDPDGNGVPLTINLRLPGQYYDAESSLHYNYLRYYDPASGRYIQPDPIGINGGINIYLYANASPMVFFDRLGLQAACGEPCIKLMCIPGFWQEKLVSSKLIDEGKWRLINVHVEPPRMPQGPKLPEGGPIGIPELLSPAQTALCFFAKTDTYRDEFSRWRQWRCLEMCPTACPGAPMFRETSNIEDGGNYVKERKERQQVVRQIKAIIPLLECMEILRGFN